MGLIREPLDVDFYFEGRQMTPEDQLRVSEYIANRKIKKKAIAQQPQRLTQQENKKPLQKKAEKRVGKRSEKLVDEHF